MNWSKVVKGNKYKICELRSVLTVLLVAVVTRAYFFMLFVLFKHVVLSTPFCISLRRFAVAL